LLRLGLRRRRRLRLLLGLPLLLLLGLLGLLLLCTKENQTVSGHSAEGSITATQ